MMRSGYDRLLMGSPLRRSLVGKAIAAALLVILAFATLVQLVVFIGMPPGLSGVFLRALALSSLLALVPLSILWFLDRRERESPWLFAAAFLWGGLIATALALPFNTAFFKLVDEWLTHHPMLEVILGPEAPLMLGPNFCANRRGVCQGAWRIIAFLAVAAGVRQYARWPCLRRPGGPRLHLVRGSP